MRHRKIQKTPVTVTGLGFGASEFGNLYRVTAPRAASAAWDAGVRYFDTAPHYGLGLSERSDRRRHEPVRHARPLPAETAADVVMPAGRCTLLDQSALDDVLPAAQAHGKSVVAVGVFNSGPLSQDRPAEGLKYDYQDAPTDLVQRALAIAEVCERYETTLPAAAIAFPPRTPPSSTSPWACAPRNRCGATSNRTLSVSPTASGTSCVRRA